MSTFQIGNYIVKKGRIGRGSFSRIYKGFHKKTKKIVAVKKIEVDDIKRISKNIKREIEVMKQLKHKNILELYDVVYDYDENYIYLIIEYCSKGDFNKFLNKRPLKEKYAKKYFRQLRDGLKYLLDNNVMHRDLKPHNILLTDKNEIKLSDFGFARYFESNKLVETLCGSPMYMAPEIMKYKSYTNKSDLWSVGIILFEALTGHPPFNAKTFYDLIKHIEKKKIVIPSNVELSKPCCNLIHQLLKKEPEDRISWSNFFYHEWFNDEKKMKYENNLLEISIRNDLSFSDINRLISGRQSIESVNSNNRSNVLSELEISSDIELSEQLLYEDDDDDDDDDDDEEYDYTTSNTPILNIPRSKPIPIVMVEDHFISESPQFVDLREGSFIIINTPPQPVIRSEQGIMGNVRSYINSSISLLKDSINYISGNNSI